MPQNEHDLKTTTSTTYGGKVLDGWLKSRSEGLDFCMPTEALLAFPWFHILPGRERLTLAAPTRAYPQTFYRIIIQQVARGDDMGADEANLGTFCTTSRVFTPSLGRVLSGSESLHIQGMPLA